MSTNDQSTPLSERFVTLRAFRWLIDRRRLRIYFFGLLCLGTLLALFYGVENWLGKRAWAKMQRELAAAGARIDFAALIPPAVPDAENFAMTPALAPLFDFKPGTQKWRDPEAARRLLDLWPKLTGYPSTHGEWMLEKATDLRALAGQLDSAADTNDLVASATAVLKALEKYQPVLQELREASRRPHCRFNLRYDEVLPFTLFLPHASILKSAAQVLAARASAELALGQTEPALQDIVLGLYLGNSLKTEPMLISYLVRCAILRALVQPIWEGLTQHQWSPAQAAELQARLEQIDLWADVDLPIQGERAAVNVVIEQIRREPPLLIQLGNESEGESDAAEQAESDSAPWLVKFLLRRIPSGWFYQEQVQYNRLFQDAVLSVGDTSKRLADPALLQAATDRLDLALAGSGVQCLLKHRALAAMLLPAVPRIYVKAAMAQGMLDLARLALALERHRQAKGQLPDALEDLVPAFCKELPRDIVKGKPLRYTRRPDGSFLLYSVGWNGQDDGGRPGLTRQGRLDLKQGDWVWPDPARAGSGEQPKGGEGGPEPAP